LLTKFKSEMTMIGVKSKKEKTKKRLRKTVLILSHPNAHRIL
jgi:hypothetical protein